MTNELGVYFRVTVPQLCWDSDEAGGGAGGALSCLPTPCLHVQRESAHDPRRAGHNPHTCFYKIGCLLHFPSHVFRCEFLLFSLLSGCSRRISLALIYKLHLQEARKGRKWKLEARNRSHSSSPPSSSAPPCHHQPTCFLSLSLKVPRRRLMKDMVAFPTLQAPMAETATVRWQDTDWNRPYRTQGPTRHLRVGALACSGLRQPPPPSRRRGGTPSHQGSAVPAAGGARRGLSAGAGFLPPAL